MKSQYADKKTKIAQQFIDIDSTYQYNVNEINRATSEVISKAYSDLTKSIDDLLDQGITDIDELNKALYESKKD